MVIIGFFSGRERRSRDNGATPACAHLGPRSDHILLKGFRGSFSHVNVFSWARNGKIPSDHNLIYSDLAIPFR